MKTLPSIDKKFVNNANFPTEVIISDRQTPNLTEQFPYTGIIKAPIKDDNTEGKITNIENSVDFTFEKQRIKALESSSLFLSIQTAQAGQDSILTSSKATEIICKNKQIVTIGQEIRKLKDFYANLMKIMCIVLTLFASVNIIVAFFAILFLSISSISVGNFMVWILLEITISIIFIIISIKGTNSNNFIKENINSFLKYLGVYLILLILLIIVIEIQKNTKDAIKCALNFNNTQNTEDINSQSMLCIMLLFMFFSCVYKLIATIIYFVLSFLLRRQLIKIEESESSANESQRIQCIPNTNDSVELRQSIFK